MPDAPLPPFPRLPRRVRVKICCIRDAHEARMAVAAGADAVGLVSAMPSGPGVIPEEDIPEIVRTLPPGVASFLLTSKTDPVEIAAQQRRCRANTLQLVDRLPQGAHAELRRELPGVALVQVVHVTGPESVDEALDVAPRVDALLLDSGHPDAEIKELGGTGRVHDWRHSRTIRDRAPVPVFLAGGLSPGNVARAVRAVEPFGVDVCSGLRQNERLLPDALEAFFLALHRPMSVP